MPALQRPSGLALCITTAPDAGTAEELVRQLVDERLIACANLLPGLTSIYRWNGEVARDSEVMVLMKAPEALVDRLMQRVSELHPYDLPEFLALSVAEGSSAYCRWVEQETTEVNA